MLAEVIKESGVDPNFIAGHYSKTHGDKGTAASRGKEIEIEYNPHPYWTIKSTITQTKAFNGPVVGGTARLHRRTHADLDDHQEPHRGDGSGPQRSAEFLVDHPIGTYAQYLLHRQCAGAPGSCIATQGKQRPQTREWHYNILTNYKLAGITDNRWLKNVDIGGAFRWEDKANIGYYGAAPDPDGIVRNLRPEPPHLGQGALLRRSLGRLQSPHVQRQSALPGCS